MQQPSSPSCTVTGAGAGGGGDDGIVIPREYLRWLLDDDDGAVKAEAALGLRAAPAAPTPDAPMQRQPSSSSCTAAGGGAGGDEEDPFDDIVIPPDLLQGLDDDDDYGCLHSAGAIMVKAEDEWWQSSSEPPVGDHLQKMQQPSSSPSYTVAGEGARGSDDPFDDIVMHQVESKGEQHRWLAEAQASGGGGGCVDDELSMTYRGLTLLFGSVPPAKVETILMLLNGYKLAPDQSVKPRPTNLVHPIVVPQDFNRAAAMLRYRKKRKSTVKADSSVRREIASRIARRRGKFAPSQKSVGETAEHLQFCANCGESSDVTPKMRLGPNGTKNFCNACGLAWATTRKIRNVTNTESGHGGSQ